MSNFKLPEYFMEHEGHLYDTRQNDWSHNPLRLNYAKVERHITNTIQVRAAIRAKFAWPGGYELFFITSDGGCLCMDCARKEYRQISWSIRNNCSDGWKVTGTECSANCDGPLNCDHCNYELISGYEDGLDAMEIEGAVHG
jgi:hypothetical protein